MPARPKRWKEKKKIFCILSSCSYSLSRSSPFGAVFAPFRFLVLFVRTRETCFVCYTSPFPNGERPVSFPPSGRRLVWLHSLAFLTGTERPLSPHRCQML